MYRSVRSLLCIAAVSLLAMGGMVGPAFSDGGPADGYNLHLQAPHKMADGTVGGPFHHYCKILSEDLLQCLLFESTDPKAKLVGIEYFIDKNISRKAVSLETWNKNFHDHKVEIATGRVQILDQPADEVKKIAEGAAMTDGIIFQLWHKDQKIPDGKVTIPTSVGHVPRPE